MEWTSQHIDLPEMNIPDITLPEMDFPDPFPSLPRAKRPDRDFGQGHSSKRSKRQGSNVEVPDCKISDELVFEEPFQEGDIKIAPAFSCGADLHMSREHEAIESDDSSSDSSMESGTGSYSDETSASVSSTDDEDVHINDPYDAFPDFSAQMFDPASTSYSA